MIPGNLVRVRSNVEGGLMLVEKTFHPWGTTSERPSKKTFWMDDLGVVVAAAEHTGIEQQWFYDTMIMCTTGMGWCWSGDLEVIE